MTRGAFFLIGIEFFFGRTFYWRDYRKMCIQGNYENYDNYTSILSAARMTPCRSQGPNDKGAAPRFAMASPSIWCRITLQAAIFSPPLCLSRPLPSYVLSFPTLEIGMMLFLIKTLTHRPTLSSVFFGLRSKDTLDDPMVARIHTSPLWHTSTNTLLEK